MMLTFPTSKSARYGGFGIAFAVPVFLVLARVFDVQVGALDMFAILAQAILISALLGGWQVSLVATIVAASAFALLQAPADNEITTFAATLNLLSIGLLCTLGVAMMQRERAAVRAGALPPPQTRPHAQAIADERFSLVFNSAPFAIMLVRVNDGQVVDVNTAFTELWKYTYAEAVGRTSTELKLWIQPEQLIEQLKKNRHSDVNELQIRTKSGDARTVLASVTMIHVDGSAHLLITAADVTERNRARHLEHIAHHDTLTQLPNRRMLWSRLKEVRERTAIDGGVSAVLFIDLDRFKEVNDKLGHRAGDELLRLVAARLKGRLRAADMLARLGGDEFVVVLEHLRERAEAQTIANDLVRQVGMPFVLSNAQEVQIGASIGISYITAESGDLEELIQQADDALYNAKHLGRSAVEIFHSPLTEQAR